MSKSVREQVEAFMSQPLEWWPQLEDAHEQAFDLVKANAKLFASAEELQQENANLRAFMEGDAKHYRQMCELVGAPYESMTGGHEHLVTYLEDYAAENAAIQQEVARLRGVIEDVISQRGDCAERHAGAKYCITHSDSEPCYVAQLRAAIEPAEEVDDRKRRRSSIRLQCPRCGTTTTAAKRDWDPVHAVLCCVYCPDCVSGGFGEYVTYYDAKGSEITDPPGGSDVLDM